MSCSTYMQYYVENRNIQLNAKYVTSIFSKEMVVDTVDGRKDKEHSY